MSREQRLQLNKKPQVQTQLGKIGSGVTQTVRMPFVQPEKSDSQKLSEAFGIALKTAGKIIAIEADKSKARESIFQKFQAQQDATKFWQGVQDEAEQLPIDQRENFVMGKFHESMEHFKNYDVTDAYLKGYMGTFSQLGDSYIAKNSKQYLNILDQEMEATTFNSNGIDFGEGESISNIINTTMTVNNVGRGDAAEIVFNNLTSQIFNKAKTDPSYDYNLDLSRLKQGSDDGVIKSYADHPTYGKMIQGLESNLATLETSRATSLSNVKEQKANAIHKQALTILYNPNSTPEDIASIKADLMLNEDVFKPVQFNKILKAIDDASSNVGFARKSNATAYTQFQSRIITGGINIDNIDLIKDKVTQAEYKTLFSLALEQEEKLKDTSYASLQAATNDLESSATSILNTSTFFGNYDTNGPERVDLFKRQFNSFIITNPDATLAERVKAQQEAINVAQEMYPRGKVSSGVKDNNGVQNGQSKEYYQNLYKDGVIDWTEYQNYIKGME